MRRDVETGEFAVPEDREFGGSFAKRRRISLHEVSSLGTPSSTNSVKEFLSSSGEILGEGVDAANAAKRIQMVVNEETDYLVGGDDQIATQEFTVTNNGQEEDDDYFVPQPSSGPADEDDYDFDNGISADDLVSSDLFGTGNDNKEQQPMEKVSTTEVQVTTTSTGTSPFGKRITGLDEREEGDYENDDNERQEPEEPILLDDEQDLVGNKQANNADNLEVIHDDTPPPPEGEHDPRHWLIAIKSRFNRFPEFYTLALVVLFLSVLLLALIPSNTINAPSSKTPAHIYSRNYTFDSYFHEKSAMERYVREYVTNITKEAAHAATTLDKSLVEPLESKMKSWLHNLEVSVEDKIQTLYTSQNSNAKSIVSDEDLRQNVQQTIAELQKHMEDEMTTQLKHLEATNSDLFERMQARLVDFEGSNKQIDSKFASVSSRISDMEAKQKAVSGKVSSMSSLIDSLETEREDVDSKVSSVLSRIARLETEQQKSLGASLPEGLSRSIDDQTLRALLLSLKNTILDDLESDKVHMPDLALRSRGAEVVDASQGYNWLSLSVLRSSVLRKFLFLKKIKRWRIEQESDPSVVLTPDMTPGNCWSFAGNKGFMIIQLPTHIEPLHFTIDHIAKSIATEFGSAPREFEVYGIDSRHDDPTLATLLLRSTFDYSRTTQTFAVQEVTPNVWYDRFRLEILSNHGHADYTCVYRFRIHGNQQVLQPRSLDAIIEENSDEGE